MNKNKLWILVAAVFTIAVMITAVVLDNGKDSGEATAQPSADSAASGTSAKAEAPVFKNVSVHDPSIVKDGDTYYVFGSHIEAAKSQDLMKWSTFTNGYRTPNNKLYGDLSKNLAGSFAWAGENDSDSKGGFSVWAPDVFYNKDYANADGTTGAYLMYYSASSTYIRSAIGYAVSKNIEGPYTYVDTVVYSGFTLDDAMDANSTHNKKWTNTNIKGLIEKGTLKDVRPEWFNLGGRYNNSQYPNAIDPNLFYDAGGKLWMAYGSWSGGIFLLEIDKATGKALYPGEDGTTADGRMIDRYFGTKIAVGYTKSGEGPYVVYHKESGYYFLYVTYGGLAADGGYNMRQFRSKSPTGPYVDAKGQNAVLTGNTDNSQYGNKLISNYQFDRKIGETGTGTGVGYVSPGHNSIYYDAETGKQFLVFHTRFPGRGESHEVRIHQMFMNKDGWPVVAPYRYAGEKLEKVTSKELIGEYKLINHGKDNSSKINNAISIRLNEDQTVTGEVNGKWVLSGDNQAEITLEGATYNGVFIKMWDPTLERYSMTFTALSQQGVSVWGSHIPDMSDKEIVAAIEKELNLGSTDKVTANLTLPTVGTRNAQIAWKSSDTKVVSDKGVIQRPDTGNQQATATLTATITKGKSSATMSFTMTVLPHEQAGLTAHYAFEDNLKDSAGKLADGTVTGDRINNAGGTITYVQGKQGKAASFDGKSGVKLPNGLLMNQSYSVALWLKPEQLTMHTTTFFGARDEKNWLSLVPNGAANGNTMIWSGSDKWFDAPTGLTIKAGEWTHLAFTVDKGAIKVYVNGTEKFSGANFPNVFTNAASSFSLGVNWWDAPFKGQMDELRIYQGAIQVSEVAKLAASQ